MRDGQEERPCGGVILNQWEGDEPAWWGSGWGGAGGQRQCPAVLKDEDVIFQCGREREGSQVNLRGLHLVCLGTGAAQAASGCLGRDLKTLRGNFWFETCETRGSGRSAGRCGLAKGKHRLDWSEEKHLERFYWAEGHLCGSGANPGFRAGSPSSDLWLLSQPLDGDSSAGNPCHWRCPHGNTEAQAAAFDLWPFAPTRS